MPKKDTDYLFVSAWLRSQENHLLTQARMEQMLEARTDADALKVLQDCGYDLPETTNVERLNQLLALEREAAWADLANLTPNTALVDAFRLKYDYHNAKVLLRAAATGANPDRLLLEAGTVPIAELKDAVLQGAYETLPEGFSQAVQDAAQTLGATRDPQRSDFLLDRAYWQGLLALAQDSGSPTLEAYVSRQIDCANLKAAVRTQRLGKGPEFLASVLAEGGSVDPAALSEAVFGSGELDILYTHMPQAAALAKDAAKGGSLTAFEKACDDAVNQSLQDVRLIPFGDGVVVAYLAAKEAELTAARIIMAGRYAGLPADTIRERLREAYV